MKPSSRLLPAGLAATLLAGGLALGATQASAAPITVGAPSVVGPVTSGPVVKDVSLTWRPTAGATGYRVQVGTDPDWSDTPSYTVDTAATQVALPAGLPHASYVWRVAALQGTGHGPWSTEGTFTKGWRDRPTPVGPSGTITAYPTYSWAPIASASAYELQVSTCPTFDERNLSGASGCPDPTATTIPTPGPTSTDNNPTQDQARPLVDTCFTTHTQVTPFTGVFQHGEDNPGACIFSGARNGTTLYWRVRGGDRLVDTTLDTDTSAGAKGVSHLPPSTPDSLANVASECPNDTKQATAAPTPSASASPSGSATPSPSGSATPSGGATPSASASAPAVVGCDPTHPLEVSAWSPTTSFTLGLSGTAEGPDYNTLPAATTRPLPSTRCTADASSTAGDNLVCDDFPTLTWDPVPGAIAYRVDVSLTDSFDNIQRVVDTRGTSWTPTDDWRQSAAGTAYFYAVQACTTKGCGAVPSRPLSFRKSTPRVRAVLPLTGQRPYDAAQDVAFAWTDLADTITAAAGSTTSEAYGYHLVVADRDVNPSLDPKDTLALDVVVDGTLCTTSTAGTAVTDRTTPAVLRCDGTGTVASASVDHVVRYVPTVGALKDGTYIWQVQAVDGSGHRLPFSAPQTFIRDTVAPRVVLSPASGVGPKGAVTATFSEPVTSASPQVFSLSPATDVTATVSGQRVTLTPTTSYGLNTLYRLVLSSPVTDLAGNPLVTPLPAFRTVATADDSSFAFAYAGSWTQAGSSSATSGHYRASVPTASRPTTATTRGTGTKVTLVSCKGPASGQLDVYVDGVKKAHVDTYRAYSGCGATVATVTDLAPGLHTVQVRGLGRKAASSRGTSVAVDQVSFS